MPANIEIKAVLRNRAAALACAARLADSGPEIIHQEDIFFRCEGARLKLRIFHSDDGDSTHGELIRYQRENRADARCSHYSIAHTSDPCILLDILTKTLGVVGTVRKTRTLYLVGQTRIHIDQVEGLGDFLELEVVLREGQTEEEGKRIANTLLAEFKIDEQDLIAGAYVDLLAARTPEPTSSF
jgi:predicted adenylyl cyclase CyaB